MAVIDSQIICTCSFRDEVKNIFGKFSQRDEEFCALAYAIAGTGIFYRCCELTKVDIKREKSAVHLQMSCRQYRDEIRLEMKLRSWKARPVLIHSHPHNTPGLSPQDVLTYDHARRESLAPIGSGEAYPVVLVCFPQAHQPKLCGFWIHEGCAYDVGVRLVSDFAPSVRRAWVAATQMKV